MSKGPLVTFGVFAAICVIGLPLIAISSRGAADTAPVVVEQHDEEGKALFVANCGACHTMEAAGTDGVVGPDLDRVLAAGGIATYEGSYGRALNAVTCGFGGGRMPAGILTGAQAKEVAAFVGAYAGQIGANPEPLADTREAPRPDPPSCAPAGGDATGDGAASGSGSEPATEAAQGSG